MRTLKATTMSAIGAIDKKEEKELETAEREDGRARRR